MSTAWKPAELKDFTLGEEGSFRALFSTYNVVDRQGDMVLPGAFGQQAVVISGYGHASWNGGVGSLPVGKGRVHDGDIGGIVEGRFFLDTNAGKQTYLVVKALEDLQEWSYSLPEVEAERRTIGGRTVRVLKRIVTNEVSPVLLGAGYGTRTLEVKGCGLCSGSCAKETGSPCPRKELKREVERFRAGDRARQDLLEEHYTVTEAVDPDVRQAAELALKACWGWMGAPWPMEIRWVTEETEQERAYVKRWGVRDWESVSCSQKFCGLASAADTKIYVVAGRDAWQTIRTVAHELRHVLQLTDIKDREQDAEAFADSFLSKFYSNARV